MCSSDLPNLIEQVYKTLSNVGKGTETQGERPTPAVALRKSVTPEYIICLEDGKKLKMLKRHLKTAYNMTPDEYRERWGLASVPPMWWIGYSSCAISCRYQRIFKHPRATASIACGYQSRRYEIQVQRRTPSFSPRKTMNHCCSPHSVSSKRSEH